MYPVEIPCASTENCVGVNVDTIGVGCTAVSIAGPCFQLGIVGAGVGGVIGIGGGNPLGCPVPGSTHGGVVDGEEDGDGVGAGLEDEPPDCPVSRGIKLSQLTNIVCHIPYIFFCYPSSAVKPSNKKPVTPTIDENNK